MISLPGHVNDESNLVTQNLPTSISPSKALITGQILLMMLEAKLYGEAHVKKKQAKI